MKIKLSRPFNQIHYRCETIAGMENCREILASKSVPWKSRVTFFRVLFISLFLFSPTSFACKGAEKTIEEYFGAAFKVFRGRIVSSTALEADWERRSLSVVTSEVFKGEVSNVERVITFGDGQSCAVGFENAELVFFTNKENFTDELSGTFVLTAVFSEDNSVVGLVGEKRLAKLRLLASH